MDKIILELVDGKPEQELMFSKDRLLSGVSRIADCIGISTLCRIFAGEDKPVNVEKSVSKSNDTLFQRIKKH